MTARVDTRHLASRCLQLYRVPTGGKDRFSAEVQNSDGLDRRSEAVGERVKVAAKVSPQHTSNEPSNGTMTGWEIRPICSSQVNTADPTMNCVSGAHLKPFVRYLLSSQDIGCSHQDLTSAHPQRYASDPKANDVLVAKCKHWGQRWG